MLFFSLTFHIKLDFNHFIVIGLCCCCFFVCCCLFLFFVCFFVCFLFVCCCFFVVVVFVLSGKKYPRNMTLSMSTVE